MKNCIDGQGNPVQVNLAYKMEIGYDQYVIIVKSINDGGTVSAFDIHFKVVIDNLNPKFIFRPKVAPFYESDVAAIIKFGGVV